MSETSVGMVVVQKAASGVAVDVDYYPQDTIQDLHNMLLEQEFLTTPSSGPIGGSYEFTLMPQNRALRASEVIADLPLKPESVISVDWAIEAGASPEGR